MRPVGISALIVAIWLAVALALDRLILNAFCIQCANVLALEITFKLPAATFNYPPVSLLVLLIIPMMLLAVYAVPWRNIRTASAWREAFAVWATPWIWLLIALFLCVLGESLYLVTKEYLPKAITLLAEKFSITGTISVTVKGFKETKPLDITASLSGVVGLTLGVYLFLDRGVNAIFKFPKA